MICETNQNAQVKPLCDPNGKCDVLPRREEPFPSQCSNIEKVTLLTKRCQLCKLYKARSLGVFNAWSA
jgi:hypothetical protein